MGRGSVKKTGYSVATMRRRIDALAEEALVMVEDGRLDKRTAHRARIHLLQAYQVLYAAPRTRT